MWESELFKNFFIHIRDPEHNRNSGPGTPSAQLSDTLL
jgi:hypothetical protein